MSRARGAAALLARDTSRAGFGDTVSRRVAQVTIGVLVLLTAVGAAATVVLLTSANAVNRLTTGYGPALDANSAALMYMLEVDNGIDEYALTGDRASLQRYRVAMPQVVTKIAKVAACLAAIDDHSLDAAVRSERELAQVWLDTVAGPAAVSADAAQRAVRSTSTKMRFERYRAASASVRRTLEAVRVELRGATQDQRRWVFPIVIFAAIGALLLAGFAAWRTARGVSRPLTAVWDVVRRLESGDLTARADESAGPAEVREVSAAVNSLADERRRAQAALRSDDELRREMRSLTSAIRIGPDPHVIAHGLVGGLGRVFDVDRVWVQTFDDPRVPPLFDQWSRDDAPAVPTPTGADGDMLRGLANRLWHSGSVTGISDHRQLTDAADPLIALAPQAAEARASAIAAIGEGRTAIGLLWLAVTDSPRTWTSTELGLLQHVAGELAQNLVQNHVLSQQREAVRRLREADEAKTALVSTVSHELRTPLTSIIGYLDLLLDMDETEVPGDVADMLRVIERNALRLRALIEDLLTQSEIEAGRRMVVLDRIDLVDVIADVDETIVPLAVNAELVLQMELPKRGVLIVDGDARQLGQAITNLVANAVKFTPRGGRVKIWASRESGGGREVLVEVSDTGIGIPPDEVPKLFGRFFRATNARSAVIPGTGLGLAIVHDIVTQHEGSIEVTSTLGVGTTFTIRLPTADG